MRLKDLFRRRGRRKTSAPLCRPEEFELDLTNFALTARTEEFFSQIAGLLRCKLDLDNKYNEVGSGVLNDAKYAKFGESPKQEGPETMTVEQVMSDAKLKKDRFVDLLEGVVKDMALNPEEDILVDGETIACGNGFYKVLTVPPLKSEARSKEKTRDDYNGNAKYLCDVGRATIVCRTEDQVARVIDNLKEKSDVVRVKNRFANPTYTGIRDVLMNIKVDSHVFEVQVHLADLLAIDKKSHGHAFYEYFREYFVGTTESYQKRSELFRRLGEAVIRGNVTDAIREILEGEDEEKLEALFTITAKDMFAAPLLNLKAQKRLLSLMLENGGEEEALLSEFIGMANAYIDQGEYEQALEWYQRALEGREASLGKEHPDTLHAVHGMALVYKNQKKYDKALEWYQRALEGYEASLGKKHKSTLDIVNNMAVVYRNQGEYEQALEWYQRALEGYEASLGKEHPVTLMTVNNMAVVYKNQGKYDKALEWYQRALEGKEASLGKEHPDTLNTVNNMAIVYKNQGKYDKALEWYQRALEGYEASLGKEHPGTLGTVNNIGSVYKNQKKYDKALEWYQRALEGYEASLGKKHASTLNTVNNMAIVYDDQKKYDKALEWYQRALEGYEASLGKHHKSTCDTAYNIANTYETLGNKEKALHFFKWACQGYEKTYGKDHSETVDAANRIASLSN